MARTFRVVVWLAVIGAVGYGAYATRDRWLGPAEKLLGSQSAAAPGEQAQGERRGGQGQGGEGVAKGHFGLSTLLTMRGACDA